MICDICEAGEYVHSTVSGVNEDAWLVCAKESFKRPSFHCNIVSSSDSSNSDSSFRSMGTKQLSSLLSCKESQIEKNGRRFSTVWRYM